MDEPSTSVARSKVRKSDEEYAESLGLPYLKPYQDLDTAPPDTRGTLGDLDEAMKLNISYYQLERQIKLFEIINNNIQAISADMNPRLLRGYRRQCFYLLKLIDEDIIRGARNKSLLTWTGGTTFELFEKSLEKFEEYGSCLRELIRNLTKNIQHGIELSNTKDLSTKLLGDMNDLYNEIKPTLQAKGYDVGQMYGGKQYYKTKKRRNKNTKKRRNKNTKKRRNKSMRSYYR